MIQVGKTDTKSFKALNAILSDKHRFAENMKWLLWWIIYLFKSYLHQNLHPESTEHSRQHRNEIYMQ